jgi:hypothetical protein
VSGALKELAGGKAAVQRPTLSAEELRHAAESPTFLFEDAMRYKSYLEMTGRLYSYSGKNLELIASQCPDAQMVASRSRWRQMGRTINDDAAPIIINVPGEIINGQRTFVQGEVYDISDTHGAAIPLPVAPAEGSAELSELVLTMQNACAVKVAYDSAATEAIYRPEQKAIVIPDGLNDTETFHVLAREGVHAAKHMELGDAYVRSDWETVASSTACVIAAHANLATDRYQFSNVPALLTDGKEVKELSGMLKQATEYAKNINSKIDAAIPALSGRGTPTMTNVLSTKVR